jgi:uncharacterized protein YukE
MIALNQGALDYIAFSDEQLRAGAGEIGRFTGMMNSMLADVENGFKSVMGHTEGWASEAANIFTGEQVKWHSGATDVNDFFAQLQVALNSAADHLSAAERAAMARAGG